MADGRPPHWVGRARRARRSPCRVEDLARRRGTVAWVEGEPGIGKSSLVAEALAATRPGLGHRLGDGGPAHRAAAAARDAGLPAGAAEFARSRGARTRPSLLRSRRLSLFAGGDASASGVEVLMTLVDELCAAAPTVLVIDDLQWADEASLVVWHQLAASIDQLRLLLIGTCRPTPRRPEVQQVRAAVARRGGAVVTLGPLPETDVAALVTAMLGAPPGDGAAPADRLRPPAIRCTCASWSTPWCASRPSRPRAAPRSPWQGAAAGLAGRRADRPAQLGLGRDGADAARRRAARREVRGHRPGRGARAAGVGPGRGPAGGGGGRHPGRLGPRTGVPASADPAGAVREHAAGAAHGAARRGGAGARGRRCGRPERRAAAFRRGPAAARAGPRAWLSRPRPR